MKKQAASVAGNLICSFCAPGGIVYDAGVRTFQSIQVRSLPKSATAADSVLRGMEGPIANAWL